MESKAAIERQRLGELHFPLLRHAYKHLRLLNSLGPALAPALASSKRPASHI